MSEAELLRKVVASLRDTAAKCDEKRVMTRRTDAEHHFLHSGNLPEPYEIEKFSRDWISGRLLGMADTIEAVIPKATSP